jgi:threonine aldolase
MNAVVASGIAAREFAAGCDSAWIDFTKGLGAPLGAALAGSRDFIERARRYKHVMGGAMRQAGMMAAGCIYALEHHVERLADDHANARLLANGLSQIPGVGVENARPETNILFFNVAHTRLAAPAFVEEAVHAGVRMGAFGDRIRAVTHLDVSHDDIEQALTTIDGIARRFAL